jgi:hypothetical protein
MALKGSKRGKSKRKPARKLLTVIEYSQRHGVTRSCVYEWCYKQVIKKRADGLINAAEADAAIGAYRHAQRQTVPWWAR